MGKEVRIGYGPLMLPIAEQLASQGLKLDDNDADKFEKQRHAINVLSLSDLLPDSQAHKCREKLHKRIVYRLEATHDK